MKFYDICVRTLDSFDVHYYFLKKESIVKYVCNLVSRTQSKEATIANGQSTIIVPFERIKTHGNGLLFNNDHLILVYSEDAVFSYGECFISERTGFLVEIRTCKFED